MQCTSDPAKYDQRNRYTEIGSKYATKINFGKQQKKLIDKIDRSVIVGPG